MITKVIIKNNIDTPLSYVKDIPVFSNNSEFNFKPGVNVIIGPNGSGKSTLLKLIEQYILIDKDKQSEKNINTLIKNIYMDDESTSIYNGVDVYSDFKLSSFRFCHINEMLEDTDNYINSFEEFGAVYETKTSSTGQGVLISLSRLFNRMFNENAILKFPIDKIKEISEYNNYKGKNAKLYLNYIKDHMINIKSNEMEFSILIDEPDRNLDIDNINTIYTILSERKDKTQVIAVIHNPLLIYKLKRKCPNINWIELEDGYINKIIESINKFID